MDRRKALCIALAALAGIALAIPLSIDAWFRLCLRAGYVKSDLPAGAGEPGGLLYLQRGLAVELDARGVVDALRRNEAALELRFRKPVTIVVCRDDRESRRIFKAFGTKSGGFAFGESLVVVNHDNAIRLGYSMESILAHESNHSLMKQQLKSIFDAWLRFPVRCLWFSEGSALAAQGHEALSEQDFRAEMARRSVEYEKRSDNLVLVPGDHRVEYALYQAFTRYLVEKHGEERYRTFLAAMLERYGDGGANFRSVFGHDVEADLPGFLDRFAR